jgi:hypothetical protein
MLAVARPLHLIVRRRLTHSPLPDLPPWPRWRWRRYRKSKRLGKELGTLTSVSSCDHDISLTKNGSVEFVGTLLLLLDKKRLIVLVYRS